MVGTAGLLYSLYLTRKGLKAAAGGVKLGKQGIDAARRANEIADQAMLAAAEANERAARANEIAARSHEVAIDNLDLLLTDFKERMRPRCVVIGVSLVDKWHEFVEAGNPVPMTITVQNMGGATGRHLLVQIAQVSFYALDGQALASETMTLRLAPLRAGQIRREPMLLQAQPVDGGVYGVTVRGRIGSMGDRIDDAAGLTMVEDFSWRENPLHRGSPDLVERAPGDDRHAGEQHAPTPPTLGAS